jgi:hypothetical protein
LEARDTYPGERGGMSNITPGRGEMAILTLADRRAAQKADPRSHVGFSRGDATPTTPTTPTTLYGCQCHPVNRKTWVVVHWRCNYSAFNGYRYTPSSYSLVACLVCDRSWRTKAAYVDHLHILTVTEAQLWCKRELTVEHVTK